MPSREELRSTLQQSRERFNAAVEGVDADVLEREPVCGVWSSRDVAGHLADWNDELLAAAEYGAGQRSEANSTIDDGEEFNTSHAAARTSQSWSEARADLDATFDRAATLLSDLDGEYLEAAAPFPWGGEGSVAEVLAAIPDHVNEHVAGLESGLDR